jgi:heptosyltransferase I
LLDQSAHFGLEIHNINNFNLSERYVVLIHGSSKKSKQWPKEHWLKVIQFFNGLGLRVLLPWGNLEEYHFSKALRKASTNSLVLPKMNISDLANVISGAKCIIGVDSGLTHLAMPWAFQRLAFIWIATLTSLAFILTLRCHQLT